MKRTERPFDNGDGDVESGKRRRNGGLNFGLEPWVRDVFYDGEVSEDSLVLSKLWITQSFFSHCFKEKDYVDPGKMEDEEEPELSGTILEIALAKAKENFAEYAPFLVALVDKCMKLYEEEHLSTRDFFLVHENELFSDKNSREYLEAICATLFAYCVEAENMPLFDKTILDYGDSPVPDYGIMGDKLRTEPLTTSLLAVYVQFALKAEVAENAHYYFRKLVEIYGNELVFKLPLYEWLPRQAARALYAEYDWRYQEILLTKMISMAKIDSGNYRKIVIDLLNDILNKYSSDQAEGYLYADRLPPYYNLGSSILAYFNPGWKAYEQLYELQGERFIKEVRAVKAKLDKMAREDYLRESAVKIENKNNKGDVEYRGQVLGLFGVNEIAEERETGEKPRIEFTLKFPEKPEVDDKKDENHVVVFRSFLFR